MKVLAVFVCFFILLPICAHTEFIICDAAENQYGPSIAFDGTNYLIVWTDGRDSLDVIYGARVSQSGTVLEPDGFALLAENDEQINPVVAFDGENYLVAWQFGC
ncbi:MAG: hypothetical protein E3J78_07990 [Candidatus Cloacimonadota bacterium]|nr:MAG: hypothetical protein E3J78_07990 [Candidatus Cloacimonadota bacterium]